MKINAKSPKTWLAALLILGAVGLLTLRLLPSRKAGSGPSVGTNPAALLVAPHSATNLPSASPVAGLTLDRKYAESHLNGWMESPLRDPFFQIKPVPPPARTNQVPELTQYQLKAIWRQHGVSMVAINSGIYHVNDSVDEYLLVKIDDHGVWLEINGKKEFLGFPDPFPVVAPQLIPAAPKPPEPGQQPSDVARRTAEAALKSAEAALQAIGAVNQSIDDATRAADDPTH
jgi:hypothetical protein